VTEEVFEAAGLFSLLSQHEGELLALADATSKPRVGRVRAFELSEIVLASFARSLPLIEATLSSDALKLRVADYEALPLRTRLYYAADLAVETPWTPEAKKRRRVLQTRVRQYDSLLFGWVEVLFGSDPAVAAQLASIRSGSGPRDDSEDTVQLVRILRSRLALLPPVGVLSPENLDLYERDASELITMLASTNTTEPGSPAELRRRAWAWWIAPYTELVELGRYVQRAHPSRHDLFPLASNVLSAAAPAPEAPQDPEPAPSPLDVPIPVA
jgi:hypothetical protein